MSQLLLKESFLSGDIATETGQILSSSLAQTGLQPALIKFYLMPKFWHFRENFPKIINNWWSNLIKAGLGPVISGIPLN